MGKDQAVYGKARRGFSLIELLVVISIIALLISLMLPSLSQSRDQARNVQCKSQMRQQAVGFAGYSTDFKGYAPLISSTSGYSNYAWMFLLSPYWNGPDPGLMMPIYADPGSGPNWVKSPTRMIKILQCPSSYGKFTMWGRNSYGINQNITNAPSTAVTLAWPVRLDHPKLQGRADLVLVGESIAFNQIMPVWNAVRLYDYLHMNQRNYVMSDGHVVQALRQTGSYTLGLFQNGTYSLGRNNHNGSSTTYPGNLND